MIGQPPCNGPTRLARRHADVGEEDLVEVAEVLVAELGERSGLDARRLHVDQERRDALVLRDVGIGAHEAQAPVGVVGARRPDLLAVDDEIVAVEHGSGRQAREVAARARFAHAEAPRDLGPQRGNEESFALLVGAVIANRRGDDAQGLRIERTRDLAARHLFEVDHLLHRCRVAHHRARAASPARAIRRRTACAATRAPSRAGARSTASVAATLRAAGSSPPATRSARRGTPRRWLRTAGASVARVVFRHACQQSRWRASTIAARGGVWTSSSREDQELLRDSVRRFLADRAPLDGYVRPLLDGADNRRPEVWDALARARRRRAARARGARRRGNGHGRRRGRARGDGSHGAPGPVHRVGDRRGLTRARRGIRARARVPASRDRDRIRSSGPSRCSSPDAASQSTRQRRPPSDSARVGSSSGTKVHVPDAVGSDVVLVTASVAGETGTAVFAVQTGSGGVAVEPVATVDGTRKQATITLDGAPGWRLGDGRRVGCRRADRRPHGRRHGDRRCRRRGPRARARGRVREGTHRVRAPDRIVPGRAASVRRHAARGRARSRCRLLRVLGRRRRRPGRGAPRRNMAKAFACEAFPQLGGSAIQVFGGIGFTWEHDIHLFYKRLLVARLHARFRRRRARGARRRGARAPSLTGYESFTRSRQPQVLPPPAAATAISGTRGT